MNKLKHVAASNPDFKVLKSFDGEDWVVYKWHEYSVKELKKRIKELESYLLKADEIITKMQDEQIKIDRENGQWLLRARSYQSQIHEAVKSIKDD